MLGTAKRQQNSIAAQFFRPLRPLVWMFSIGFLALVAALIWLQFNPPARSGSFVPHANEILKYGIDYQVAEWHENFAEVPASMEEFTPFHVVSVTLPRGVRFNDQFTLKLGFAREQLIKDPDSPIGWDAPADLTKLGVYRFSTDGNAWRQQIDVRRVADLFGVMFELQSREPGVYAMGVSKRRTNDVKASGPGTPDANAAQEPESGAGATSEPAAGSGKSIQDHPLLLHSETGPRAIQGYVLALQPGQPRVGNPARVFIAGSKQAGEPFWAPGQHAYWYLLLDGDEMLHAVPEKVLLTSEADAFSLDLPTHVARRYTVVFELRDVEGTLKVSGRFITSVLPEVLPEEPAKVLPEAGK